MIVHDVEQGSDEWLRLRMGKPTASNFHQIMQPSNLKRSKSYPKYLARLGAEVEIGAPCDGPDSMWIGRGSDM